MNIKNRGLWVVLISIIAFLLEGCHHGSSTPVTPTCSSVYGPMRLSGSQQLVYNYAVESCISGGEDYADNPARPFLVGSMSNPVVKWFASNAKGYLAAQGVSVGPGVSDILAKIVWKNGDTTCGAWLTSRFNDPDADPPVEYPVSSYNNEIWMVVPYTNDGQNVYALVHNEYHIQPTNTTDVYGNLIGVSSTDGASTFNFYHYDSPQDAYNVPVIVVPYPDLPPYNHGKGGMFAQSNIIKWGAYYYMLVFQDLEQIQPDLPASDSGVCIYRTSDVSNFRSWLGWNASTGQYNIPLVPEYPADLANPEQYLCSPVTGLPNYYHFSWSYNVQLHKFIVIGLDTDYKLANGQTTEAFVYTLADLNPVTGELTAATNTGTAFQEYLIQPVVGIDEWQRERTVTGQFYPSILDPESPELTDSSNENVLLGDRNFQYSSTHPYIYYTLLQPFSAENPQGHDRDIAREEMTVENCSLPN